MSEVDDLAAAVIDGDLIDWPAARSRLRSSRVQHVAGSLETLSSLTTPVLAPSSATASRLPWFLESVRLLAFVCCATGLAGVVAAGSGSRPVRSAVMTAILCLFGGVACYLDLGGRDRRARALAACFWMTAASFSARGIIQLAQLWPSSSVVRGIAALRPEAMLAAAFWQFARDFPATTRFSRLDRVCDFGLRIAVVVGTILFMANLVPFVWPGSAAAHFVAPLDRIAGDGPIFWNCVFGMAIPSLFVIAWRGRSVVGTERVRVRVFLYSVAFAFAPVMTQVFVEGLFPAYMRLMRTPSGLFWSGLVVYPPLFQLPVTTAYAVAADNVLGIRVVVQQGLRYLLTRWLLMWGATVPIVALAVVLYRHADQPLATTLAIPPAPALMWFAGIGVVALACRSLLVQALDRWSLSDSEAPSVALAAMTERMKQTRTASEVASVLADSAGHAMQAAADIYIFIDGEPVPAAGGTKLLRPSVIDALLQGSREPCVVTPTHRQSYYGLITDQDRRWIDAHGIEVLVPVLSGRSANRLFGIVALAGRRNALTYSPDDLRFLKAAAASASLACDAIASDGQQDTSGLEELATQCTTCWRVDTWTERRLCSCGGTLEAASLPKLVLSRFELRERLGAGGMGVVYRATDLALGRDVAMKTLPMLSEDAALRLTLEARTMAGLSHADVAVLYGAERWRGTPLLIMEYLAGGTLAARLRRGALPAPEALLIARRLAAILEHLNEAGLYHGDIKPSNVGFASDGEPKLLDFGLARVVSSMAEREDGLSRPRGPLGGTLAYLSPEVRSGAPAGPALDLWALSVLLCEILLGRHPFSRAQSTKDIADGVDAAMAALRPSVPAEIIDLLSGALSIPHAARPQSASEFGRALDALFQKES